MAARRAYFPERGNDGYTVQRYDLVLDYRVGPGRLGGSAVVSAVAGERLERLSLDLGAFRVSRVLVDGAPARFRHHANKLHVTPGRRVPGGAPFTVEVRYAGGPRPLSSPFGGLGWEQLADGALVASQPTGAPSWFPCDDRPGAKAPFRITLTTAAPYHVVANGRLAARTRSGASLTWVYEQAEPMATYLASVQIGRYKEAELTAGQRLVYPARLGTRVRHDFARQPRMMAAFTEWFGPYPFEDYTVVVTDDELEIPVEAQGMSIFGANHVDGRRGAERLVAHELAHQWFGNSLTLTGWHDIWLHEGFAAYAEWLWSEHAGGRAADEHARLWHRRLAAQPQDFTLADPGPRRIFDDRVYKRGALTLHALRRAIGDRPFFALLADWTAAHRHGTVTTEAFTVHATRYATTPLAGLFASWLHAPRLPALP